ncbi:MAG: hypothetical protein SF339_13670 [Blastocatellia bacterium]|nr:hypothetical protein [Blastocatellia bacterium]
MNCNQIREAIDTATRRQGYGEAVKAHLGLCVGCRRHADEASALLSLLAAQPRVEAPADFDFRLRARMARARAEQQSSAGLLERFWARSFSFGQAATAMAAIAVAVTASTFYFKGSDQPIIPAATEVAMQVNTAAPAMNPSTGAITAPAATRAATVRYARTARPATVAVRPAAAMEQANLAAGNSRVYSREIRQVIPDRNLIGAEAVSAKNVAYLPSL